MTDAFISLQTADMLRLLGGLGLALQLLAHARAALRPQTATCNAHFATNATAGLLMFPAAWSLLAPAFAIIPAAWVGLSLFALALRRARTPAKPRPAEIPWSALTREATIPPGHPLPNTLQSPPKPRAAARNTAGLPA